MHSLWSALKKRNYLYVCIQSPVCLPSYIIYHHPLRYLGHIRNPDSSKSDISLIPLRINLVRLFGNIPFL
jgi:hypothetical protein